MISHRRLLEGGGYLLSRFRSTIGVIRFNFSVRNGKRWSPYAIFTLIFSLSPCAGSVLSLGKGVPEAGETSAKPSHNRLWSVLFVFVDELLHLFLSTELRAISTARLSASPHLHLRPIDVVVCDGPWRDLILEPASCLDAFSTYPAQTRLPGGAPDGTTRTPEVCPTRSSRTSVGSPQISAPTTDRDRTVSRRSEPSSRTALMGEQPNPWDLLQPQDAMSRHRGAKPLRRCELLGVISLLSPG